MLVNGYASSITFQPIASANARPKNFIGGYAMSINNLPL
jgi:hypothetical protein